jgi:hypothetical protein
VDGYLTLLDNDQGAPPPCGVQKICVYLTFDIKHCLRCTSHLVGGGHKVPNEISTYTRLASIHSMQTVMFLAELNGLKLYGGDVGKVYLEVQTGGELVF